MLLEPVESRLHENVVVRQLFELLCHPFLDELHVDLFLVDLLVEQGRELGGPEPLLVGGKRHGCDVSASRALVLRVGEVNTEGLELLKLKLPL